MATFHQCVLPSGVCLRFKALATREKLAIERDLIAQGKVNEKGKISEVDSQVETLARCIVAHTVKQAWLFKSDDEGKKTNVADTDAMLAAVPSGAWQQANPVSLRVEGTSVVDILSFLPDYEAAWVGLAKASGFGVDRPLVSMTLTTVSVE